jgi:hypothetical protein
MADMYDYESEEENSEDEWETGSESYDEDEDEPFPVICVVCPAGVRGGDTLRFNTGSTSYDVVRLCT